MMTVELHDCPSGDHSVWWKVTETATCPWCQLKELTTTDESSYIVGWNACEDSILDKLGIRSR